MAELLLGLFILSVLYYYGCILINFVLLDYKTKRELILDLIPFRGWYVGMVRRWNKLK